MRTGRPKNVPEGDSRAWVLSFINVFSNNHGYPPSVRELCEGMGTTSTGSMHYHLTRLAKDELIKWNPGEARTIRLTDKGRQELSDLVA
jgi:repressor LexA